MVVVVCQLKFCFVCIAGKCCDPGYSVMKRKKLKPRVIRKTSGATTVAEPVRLTLSVEKFWPLLLIVFFMVSPLFVVSGYTPEGKLFCTLYNFPKFYFIAACIPLFGLTYGFYLYQKPFLIEPCMRFLRFNIGVKIFLVLLLVMALSVLQSLVVQAGIYYLLDYSLLGVLSFILAQLFQENRLRWLTVYALLGGLLIFTGLGLFQFFGYKIHFLLPILGPASTFGYRNPAAHFIALVLPFVLFAAGRHWHLWRHSQRSLQLVGFIALIILTIAALVLLFVNYSRVAIMALLAEALVVPFFWFLSRKRDVVNPVSRFRRWLRFVILTSLLLVIVVSLVMVFPNSRKRFESSFRKFQRGGVARLFEARYYHWGNTLMMIKEHPVSGVGLGNWRFNYPLYYKSFAPDPTFNYNVQVRKTHNDYLQLAAECGIPALLLFLLLWGRQFYLLRYSSTAEDDGEDWRLPILAVLIAFSVIMFFSFPMQMAYSRMFCFFLLALGEARAWPASSK